MAQLIGRNIVKFILLMIAISIVTFVLVGISPIDPVQANVGQTAYASMSDVPVMSIVSGVPVIAFTTFEMLSLFNKSFHDCAWLLVPISKNTAIKASDTMFFFICN